MWAYYGSGRLYVRQGDVRRALPLLEQAMRLCQQENLRFWFPNLAMPLGLAYALRGQSTEAVPLLTQALEQTIATGRIREQVVCCLGLGEVQWLAGCLEEAHTLSEQALLLAQQYHQRHFQAYALRLLGEIAARRDPLQAEQAEAHYCQALALAEELGMRPLQAHCHLGLGTLYGQTGRTEPGRAALTAAIALYRALDMTFWLPQAEAALAHVEGE